MSSESFDVESFDVDWSLDYCLACDKQTNGGVYCSESCRLTEYEKGGSDSEASSPTTTSGAGSWPTTRLNHGFYLPPAYDFSAHKAYGSTPQPRTSSTAVRRPQSSPAKRSLTPSTSQSSLFSMQSSSSTNSNNDQVQLSEEARKELQAYNNFFDQSRYQRRASSH